MLQWMGGSRRKVTTSRKSTHKRQKQYFEQRKRQQQQTAGIESYSDGKRSSTLQCEHSRSLDILSLENVSTVVQDHKTSCITARDNSEHDDFTLYNQDALPSQVSLTRDGISVDQSKINVELTPSSYVTVAEYPEKVSVHLPNGNENLVGNINELDSFRLPMSHQISVIDLLGDGGANTNVDKNSLHEQEAHVAFSVEGLGQVETETPVHSPKIPGRSFLNCYTPPKKAARVPVTSKHLDYDFHGLGSGLDIMMQDIDFSPRDRTTDQTFGTRDVMNIAGDPNQEFINFRRPSPNNSNSRNMQGFFGHDEFLYCNRDSRRNIWNAGPSFLDDGIDDLGKYFTNFDKRDVGFDDYFHSKNIWKQDLNFEGWDLNKKRSSIRIPETYYVKESPVPYQRHIPKENLHGVRISDMRWRSAIEINNGVKDAVGNSVTEDSRESLSLLRFKIYLLACTYHLSFYSELIGFSYSELIAVKNHALPLQPRNHDNWGMRKTKSGGTFDPTSMLNRMSRSVEEASS
ncbi:hypothetical protein C2S51_023212 [Perilla frutescens var. frutescens]|nr:hypothetical protein C2S51_023212 [Perilla frutescens var. frutescens]